MPPSRRNPADAVEEVAAATVAGWLGDRGVLVDTSRGNGPDFRIDYCDGRVALGEVSWHADQAVEAMWSNAEQSELPQLLQLRAGSGQWSVLAARP